MRSVFFAVSVAMLVAAPSAGAQSKDYPLTNSGELSTVQVTAPFRPYEVSPEDTDWITGGYKMSNGWRLDVKPTDDGIVAKIDKQRPMHLIALSADNYVTADGNVVMEFNRGARGDEMVMSYVPQSNVAVVVVMKASLAAR